MTDIGFPCSANNDAKVLILGSMPSVKSLAKAEYYGHPQNSFWPIAGALFGFDAGLPYAERLRLLRKSRVALWDVAHQCVRAGSMDSAIQIESVVANNFESFFTAQPDIQALFFNGRKAEELYRRLVLSGLSSEFQQIEQHLLPSTSPANAAMNRARKLESWEIVKQALEKEKP